MSELGPIDRLRRFGQESFRQGGAAHVFDLLSFWQWYASEQGITCRRILSDKGSAYCSGESRKACKALNLKPIRTRPYGPCTSVTA